MHQFFTQMRTYATAHQRIIGTGLIIVAVIGYIVVHFMHTADVAPAMAARVPYTLVAAAGVPLTVEGVLVPKDDALIAAQSQGRLASVPAREGALVSRGDVLAVVGQPVLAAQREALLTQIASVEAQRTLAETVSEGAQVVAAANQESGRAVTDAGVMLAESQYRAAQDGLVNALESNYLSATEALKFLADTPSVITREVSELRNEAARLLAGSSRASYLGEKLRTGDTTVAFIDDLHAVTESGISDSAELLALADRMQNGLQVLGQAYEAAERSAYDRGGSATESERAAYNAYRTAVRSAQGAVQNARGAYRTAEQTLASAQVTATETVSVRGAQLAQATMVHAGESKVSDATLTNLYAELHALDTSLGEAVVRAPFSGTVTAVYVDPGAYVGPGTPVARLHSVSGYEVECTIAPRYVGDVAPGTTAVFDGVTGVVDRVAPQIDEHTGGASVFVTLDGAHDAYVSGMRMRGELRVVYGDHKPTVFLVPHGYLAFDFNGPEVHTVDSVLSVTIIRDTEEGVYVTGNELTEGLVLVR